MRGLMAIAGALTLAPVLAAAAPQVAADIAPVHSIVARVMQAEPGRRKEKAATRQRETPTGSSRTCFSPPRLLILFATRIRNRHSGNCEDL